LVSLRSSHLAEAVRQLHWLGGFVLSRLAIASFWRHGAARNHLNCGTVGTLMRGGGIEAILGRFWLGFSPESNAPNAEPFSRPAAKCPVATDPPARPPPPPRANEAAGTARTMNNAMATFTEVFDMGILHSDSLEGWNA
jgi:hypothetical protein